MFELNKLFSVAAGSTVDWFEEVCSLNTWKDTSPWLPIQVRMLLDLSDECRYGKGVRECYRVMMK